MKVMCMKAPNGALFDNIFDGFRPSLSNDAPFGAFDPIIRINSVYLLIQFVFNLFQSLINIINEFVPPYFHIIADIS